MASESAAPRGTPGPGTGFVYVCERCGERMEERQCKIVCGNCGYWRDCSDP